jgi:hypothetical protein
LTSFPVISYCCKVRPNKDTTLMGRVAVRETLVLRLGYSGTDFTQNIVRCVCEERLNLTVGRPGAI